VSDEARDSVAEEALRRLEARLERASEAAERLVDEAARAATGASSGASSSAPSGASSRGRRPPPSGWGTTGNGRDDRTSRDRTAEDLELLAQVADRLRELIPFELQRRLAEALRELLLAVRALIDWWLERLERRRGPAPEVRDIPIL
jgi:hypothetical protein